MYIFNNKIICLKGLKFLEIMKLKYFCNMYIYLLYDLLVINVFVVIIFVI